MFRPTRWFPDSSVTPRPPPTCTCSNRSAALLQLNKVTKAMADAEECIRLKPDWEKGYFRKGNAFETLAKTEEVRVRPPKLLSHTVHLQRKLTFNFCCRCCCEKGSGGVQDRRGEEPGQQGLLEQGQAAHQGGAEAEGQGRKVE